MKPEYKPFVDELIELCIREDIGDGDHTSLSCIPADEHGRMRLLCKQEGTIHPDRDREELVADLVALHRGMLLEWRIFEGAFDLPRRGRRMAAALLEGWRHEEE